MFKRTTCKRIRKAAGLLSLALVLLLTLAPHSTSDARDSIFTQKGTGPLYWIAYEQCFITDQPITQLRFLANVDWVANNFRSHGYDMICTDGWIEDSTRTNLNGYITHYNDNWTMTWQDLINYCNARGLKLGVYYNPLWVTPSAVNDISKTVIGTNIKVGDIVDKNYVYPGFNPQNLPGDRFGYLFNRSNDKTLWWVDVARPGAKEYIQGYVKYFKNMGVRYLRIDFLSWYEDGMDKGTMVGRNHGRNNYATALQWIKEAAGTDMELSLVMPHLYNNGELELQNGDMARINEDCWTGSWFRFSDMDRGIKRSGWSQYANAFDGLIYWSKFFGKGKMIADADMLRLNTFANDSERMAAVSLCAMAGAPINIADQYDTIGNSAWVYQNSEILDLNKQGFVGKPIKSDPLDNYNSQRWVGMLPDGSWVVGLFNREGSNQWRGVDFWIDLGINGSCTMRDLWAHKNFGPATFFGLDMVPRSCFIYKVTPPATALKNGGFETRDISGWAAANTADTTNFGVDNVDVSTGQNKLYFWKTSSYWQTIYQTKTGLPNGSYTVKARCKQNTGTPTTCRMEVSDYGGTTVYRNISHGSTYNEYTATVNVTNGQLKVGFHIFAPGNTNLQVDDVQLIKN